LQQTTVTTGNIIFISMLATLARLSWVIPRQVGVLGIFVAHVVVLAGFLFAEFAGVAITEQYRGGMELFGTVLMAFAFNCQMLPVTIGAAARRRAVLRWNAFTANERDSWSEFSPSP
jgi:hypothetical protein